MENGMEILVLEKEFLFLGNPSDVITKASLGPYMTVEDFVWIGFSVWKEKGPSGKGSGPWRRAAEGVPVWRQDG